MLSKWVLIDTYILIWRLSAFNGRIDIRVCMHKQWTRVESLNQSCRTIGPPDHHPRLSSRTIYCTSHSGPSSRTIETDHTSRSGTSPRTKGNHSVPCWNRLTNNLKRSHTYTCIYYIWKVAWFYATFQNDGQQEARNTRVLIWGYWMDSFNSVKHQTSFWNVQC